ncbi:MAG: hypothetical protein ACIAQZ_06525 [Sedimentisphaeraceae bacterium JB056]
MCGKLNFNLSLALKASILCILASMSLFCGCSGELADLMDDGPTATEAKIILDKGSEIRATPDVSNPLPEVYRKDPEILKTSKGWKLFYYARNHSPKTLESILKGQLKNSVSVADDTNQLIINCADQADVDQVLAYLDSIDIAPIQVKIDCIVVENYADVTMDRETQVKVGDIAGDAGLIIEGPDNGWGTFPGASIRESRRVDMGMSVGYNSNDLKFLVDMLVSRGYLKVLMNPTVETVTGKTATVTSLDKMPIIETVTDNKTRTIYDLTKYKDIVDSLKATPVVFADGSVSLTCEVQLSSKNTPEGVAQLPIVTEKTINLGSTRLEPGKSLVVGGFRKSEKSSVIRGFPFLKDIPIIGIVFSSRDFEERAKEITFILTPSISTGGTPYSEMLENMAKDQFNQSDPNDIKAAINKVFTDPFGKGAYTDEINRNRETDSIKRLQAEIKIAETELEAQKAREELEEYKQKIQQESALTQKASEQKAAHAKEIEELEKTIEKLDKDIAAQKAEYQKTLAETQKETDVSKQEAEKVKQKASETQKQLEQSKTKLDESLKKKQLLEKETENLIKSRESLQKQIAEIEKQIQALKKSESEAAAENAVTEQAPEKDETDDSKEAADVK